MNIKATVKWYDEPDEEEVTIVGFINSGYGGHSGDTVILRKTGKLRVVDMAIVTVIDKRFTDKEEQ